MCHLHGTALVNYGQIKSGSLGKLSEAVVAATHF